MSELDGVKQAIELVRNEVAQAKMDAEVAQSTAGDKVNELAMLGLEGVAQVLQTVADAMSTAVSQLGVGHQLVDETVTSLLTVTDKTKMSDTAAAMDAALEKLAAVDAQVQGAGAQAGEALTHAQESEVEPVMNAVAAAIASVDKAKAVNETAKVKTNEHRTKIDQAGKGLLAASAGGGGSPPPGELVATRGEPVPTETAGPPDSSDHQTELKSTDDGDKGMSKFRRTARALSRNASDLQSQTKDTTKSAVREDSFFDPPDGDTYTSVGVATTPQILKSSTQADSMDVVLGHAMVITVFAVTVASRIRRKSKD